MNYSPACIRYQGTKYVAWVKARNLALDIHYIGGIFKKNGDQYTPIVKAGETHLHKDKNGFVHMFLNTLVPATFPVKDFIYHVDFDNEEIIEVEGTGLGEIKGHTSILKHKFASQEEVNDKVLEDLCSGNNIFPGQVLVCVKGGGAKQVGYLHPECLDFTTTHSPDLFYQEVGTGAYKPIYPAISPLKKTQDRYDFDFVCNLRERLKPATIPFESILVYLNLDEWKVYRLQDSCDVRVPSFIKEDNVDESTMQELLLNEDSDVDHWLFFSLFCKASENQGGLKINVLGKDISPFAEDKDK